MVDYLYHPTLTRNLPNILDTGLKPSLVHGIEFSTNRLNVVQKLDSAELFADHIASSFATGATVLRFPRDGLVLKFDEFVATDTYVETTVPASQIEVSDGNIWMPLATLVAGLGATPPAPSVPQQPTLVVGPLSLFVRNDGIHQATNDGLPPDEDLKNLVLVLYVSKTGTITEVGSGRVDATTRPAAVEILGKLGFDANKKVQAKLAKHGIVQTGSVWMEKPPAPSIAP